MMSLWGIWRRKFQIHCLEKLKMFKFIYFWVGFYFVEENFIENFILNTKYNKNL